MEQDLIRCISNFHREDWDSSIAVAIGKLVREKNWKDTAETLYVQFNRSKTTELQLALDYCKDQLSIINRTLFSLSKNAEISSNINDRNDLALAVAELGADLAPNELDDIWERAGGKRKDLKIEGTPSNRWQEAARLAENGKISNGISVLLEELKRNNPYNQQLIDLSNLLRKNKV